MKARLARYAPVQLLDYMVERGGVTFVMGALFGWMTLASGPRNPGWQEGAQGLATIKIFFASLLGFFTWFGTLTAVNGIVSNDRVKGTFRFLFSKPVSVPGYYAQLWAMNGIGLMLVMSALLALFSVAVRPFFPPLILMFVAVSYVLQGGLGFLLSAITKRDGYLLVGFWLIALVLRLKYGSGTGFVAKVVMLLTPPAREMTSLIAAILQDTPIEYSVVWNALGYGAVCFAAALVVLRYRPMTS